MCILSIVALLYPLEYMFPVIPLLPAYMPSAEQLLLAPTPFLIGVPSSFFHHRKIRDLPSDVILVDLDTNCLHVPDDLYIPELPEPDVSELKERLKEAINKMTTMTIDNENCLTDADLGIDIDSVDVACRVAMVSFLYSISCSSIFIFRYNFSTLRTYSEILVSIQELFDCTQDQLSHFKLIHFCEVVHSVLSS